MGEISEFLNLPIPSGNVSFYNESLSGSVLPTAVILGAGLIDDSRKSISSDLKKKGSWLYLVGETRDEMGGSEYYRLTGASSPKVPNVDSKVLKKSMDFMLAAMGKGLVLSCHDVSHGGLAVAVSEMCISGQLGAEIDLGQMNKLRPDVKLFSESNTRWVVEADRKKAGEFEKLAGSIPICRLGKTGGKDLEISDDGKKLISIKIKEIENAWRSPLWRAMGGE
jgi:phosphoribosylformylglycinamidine synthase